MISSTPNEYLRYAKRQHTDCRCLGVAFGNLGRPSSEHLFDYSAAADLLFERKEGFHIYDSAQVYSSADRQRIADVNEAALPNTGTS
ncbi:MAG TPA: hypothetical protein VH117_10285, partial [Edaphobacter sp.]|nr:hypothetical protein [Edaphobacter sp.]